MSIFAILSAAALSQTAVQPTVIVIDYTQSCSYGRISDYYRRTAKDRALKLARKLRDEGRQVVVIEDEKQIVIKTPTTRLYKLPGC
jgi:hypothetical protein